MWVNVVDEKILKKILKKIEKDNLVPRAFSLSQGKGPGNKAASRNSQDWVMLGVNKSQ